MQRAKQVKGFKKSFGRLSRFITQLMREQLTSGPVTLQQCFTLEALADGPKFMKDLAAQVAIHQSTLTRIVEKLEKRGLVTRTRKAGNLRSVQVQVTDEGKKLYLYLESENIKLISNLLDLIPTPKRDSVVESMEILAGIFDPEKEAFQKLLEECCSSNCCNGGVK